jgi:hypothetical protein
MYKQKLLKYVLKEGPKGYANKSYVLLEEKKKQNKKNPPQ